MTSFIKYIDYSRYIFILNSSIYEIYFLSIEKYIFRRKSASLTDQIVRGYIIIFKIFIKRKEIMEDVLIQRREMEMKLRKRIFLHSENVHILNVLLMLFSLMILNFHFAEWFPFFLEIKVFFTTEDSFISVKWIVHIFLMWKWEWTNETCSI